MSNFRFNAKVTWGCFQESVDCHKRGFKTYRTDVQSHPVQDLQAIVTSVSMALVV